jgi:ubiquitin-conjugating enzyme E2 variant
MGAAMAATIFWIFACILIADFITGFFHWFEDTWITLETPLLGKVIGVPNVEHHQNPGLLAKMGTFISRNTVPVILVLIGLGISWLLGFFCWQVALVGVLAALGNEVHEWNHSVKPKNWLVAFIQDSGLVQTKQQHALHHKRPYDRYYCTLTNFTNAVMERIYFWRGLEWFCMKVFRMKMKRLSPERNGY